MLRVLIFIVCIGVTYGLVQYFTEANTEANTKPKIASSATFDTKSSHISNEQAAKETYIDGLQLLDYPSGVSIGYVTRDVTPGGGKYFCGGLNEAKSKEAGQLIQEALQTLPESSLSQLNLKYVIVCGLVKVNQQPIGGIPVPPLNLLMISTKGLEQNPQHLKYLVLHELYHLFEYRFNSFNDTDWKEQFGTGYIQSYQGLVKYAPIGSGRPGFLNAYALTFPHEERAEIFAHMILDSQHVNRYLDTSMDVVLRDKIEFVMNKVERFLGEIM